MTECETASTPTESETRPTHYSRYDPEPIVVIEKWNLGFHLGNVVKYVARSPYKGTELRDLRKARWYLDRKIAIAEARETGKKIPMPHPQS